MHPALEFLTLLDPTPEAIFCIETRTDVPKGAKKTSAVAIPAGRLEKPSPLRR